jgi:hypothetical protein
MRTNSVSDKEWMSSLLPLRLQLLIILKQWYTFIIKDGEGKHRQPTIEHLMIVLLIPEQNVLIGSESVHCNVHLCTIVCNINIPEYNV